jgi:hypothetical protein
MLHNSYHLLLLRRHFQGLKDTPFWTWKIEQSMLMIDKFFTLNAPAPAPSTAPAPAPAHAPAPAPAYGTKHLQQVVTDKSHPD